MLGQAFQRQPRGGNAVRVVAMLPALTGNIGCAGAGWAYVTGRSTRGVDGGYLAASHLARSPADLRLALQREDLLTVSVELFQTDTAVFADYVLPAASFLESDDLVCSYFTKPSRRRSCRRRRRARPCRTARSSAGSLAAWV